MMMQRSCLVWATSLVVCLARTGLAQPGSDFSQGLFPGLSRTSAIDDSQDPAVWSAQYRMLGDGHAELDVTARLARGWHVYSTTQPAGGPTPTKLSISKPKEVTLKKDFTPDREPLRSVSTEFNGLSIEEYDETVTWSSTIKLPNDFKGPITVDVRALVCKSHGACIPINESLIAEVNTEGSAGGNRSSTSLDASEPSAQVPLVEAKSAFRDEDYVIEWRGTLSPSQVAPGGRATLTLIAIPDEEYHTYPAATDDAKFATNVVIAKKAGLRFGKPMTDAKLISDPNLPQVQYHDGTVTWKLPVEVPSDAGPGPYDIEGFVAYQACDANSCREPKAIQLMTQLTVASTADVISTPESNIVAVVFKSANIRQAKDAAAEIQWVDENVGKFEPIEATDSVDRTASISISQNAPETEQAKTPMRSTELRGTAIGPATGALGTRTSGTATSTPLSFTWVLLIALIGGVILNIMPCVLPVVGLKIMSFVKQAGEDRSRVLLLNVIYALGILFVFALLAALAVFFQFAWGEQFTFLYVRLGLAVVLFALALSYFGVWEIPVPGMASGKVSGELQRREGLVGAFSKGVFATILATPCSGPMLGGIFALTFTLSPPQAVLVIMVVGVGMAFPYFVLGAKPSLVSWLPKPGPWMETFKQFLAFLLLGTVAFFFAGFKDELKLPVFVTLIGVWFGCWLIGLVPVWESMNKRVTAWISGTLSAIAIGVLSFLFLVPGVTDLKWVPYNEAHLQQLQREGRTVMVDFTASWCVNCKLNYVRAIDTDATRKLVEELDAIPMLADWSDYDPIIKSKLTELNSNSIPVLAIYPGNNPGAPIVLRDILSQTDVLDALRQAGPSVGRPGITRAARSEDSSVLTAHIP